MSDWLQGIIGRTERKAAKSARAKDRLAQSGANLLGAVGQGVGFMMDEKKQKQEQENWQDVFDRQGKQWDETQKTAAENLAQKLKLEYGEGIEPFDPFDIENWPEELVGTPLHRQWVDLIKTGEYRDKALSASLSGKAGDKDKGLTDAFYEAVGVVSDIYGENEEKEPLFKTLVKDPAMAEELKAAFVDAMALNPLFVGNEEAAKALFDRMLAGEIPVEPAPEPGALEAAAGEGRGGGGGSSWGDEPEGEAGSGPIQAIIEEAKKAGGAAIEDTTSFVKQEPSGNRTPTTSTAMEEAFPVAARMGAGAVDEFADPPLALSEEGPAASIGNFMERYTPRAVEFLKAGIKDEIESLLPQLRNRNITAEQEAKINGMLKDLAEDNVKRKELDTLRDYLLEIL